MLWPKGKSAVMNNVCKSEEGGEERNERGRGKLFTTTPALPFLRSSV